MITEQKIKGAIPIVMELQTGGDKGRPLMIDFPDSETGEVFKEIARLVYNRPESSENAR